MQNPCVSSLSIKKGKRLPSLLAEGVVWGMHVFYGWARAEDLGAGAGLGSLNGAVGFFPFLFVCPDTVLRSSESKTNDLLSL